MALLTAENISKSYTEKQLLNNVTINLNKKDKIGIIGINGTGKSTLLKILAGTEDFDSGKIVKMPGTRINFLDQSPIIHDNLSIIDNIFIGLDKDIRDSIEYQAKSILTKLSISDFDNMPKNMSGGEKKRIAIAKAIVTPCEILILDEPTNHLDSNMILWLENFLKSFNKTIVMVTHDRYFLDRVANKIIEIDNGSLFSYEGNYSKFLELKSIRESMNLATQRKNATLYKKELVWMSRGPRARGTKSKSRIDRFTELENGKVIETDKIDMNSVSTRLGKKIIEINNISKSFDNKIIIKDFSYNLLRNARIGIIGKNGAGKSTLIKIITGSLSPDSGNVISGETVNIGILSQDWVAPPDDMRIIDYIKEFGNMIHTNDGTISASNLLENFLFPPSIQWNLINNLSGGEKRRLYLLKILIGAPNILFLDEPTNDLDIETLNILENYLETFSGAVITISHDRYFLDKVVDTILELKENGKIQQYNGGYSDYLTKKTSEDDVILKTSENKIKKDRNKKPCKIKFTYKEEKEFETIDSNIENLENKIKSLELEIQKNSSTYEKLTPLLSEKEKIELELSEKMERWIYLNNLNENINNQ